LENTVSIELHEVGKKFNREWIFQACSLSFDKTSKTVILGNNGSGKSTLLQIISGYLIPDKGKVNYYCGSELVKTEDVNNLISIASPYLQLTEEFTLNEILNHYKLFKPLLINDSNAAIADSFQLDKVLHKQIRHFSSGMKQRVKLGLAITANAPVLFLDEPLSNLDAGGMAWYQEILKKYAHQKTLIVCSNAVKEEYFLCEKQLNMADYKGF
jgi:ABC-2 type transport system ATP-binding protein